MMIKKVLSSYNIIFNININTKYIYLLKQNILISDTIETLIHQLLAEFFKNEFKLLGDLI